MSVGLRWYSGVQLYIYIQRMNKRYIRGLVVVIVGGKALHSRLAVVCTSIPGKCIKTARCYVESFHLTGHGDLLSFLDYKIASSDYNLCRRNGNGGWLFVCSRCMGLLIAGGRVGGGLHSVGGSPLVYPSVLNNASGCTL